MEKRSAIIKPTHIEDSHSIEHPSSSDKALSDIFSQLSLKITSETIEELVIEMKGIDIPLANALRRIMISEVATMAIEDVDLYQNTSVIPDEVLAHRLGLIPIKADPDSFKYKQPESDYTPENSILFKLHAKCVRLPDGKIKGENVYSGDLEWVPLQGQEKIKARPVNDDILIARLGPGQEIEAELRCEKGIGATHTKWSPVCTASYRLMPKISFFQTLKGENAKVLKKTCPVGVFDIEDGKAVVKKLRACTSCRECIRDESLGVVLEKVKDHFICKFYLVTIESTGILEPRKILREAIKVLKNKTNYWLETINIYKHTPR